MKNIFTNDMLEAIQNNFTSLNEFDSNGEPANVVDGLFAIARAVTFLGKAILVVNHKNVGDVEAELGLNLPTDNYVWPKKKKSLKSK